MGLLKEGYPCRQQNCENYRQFGIINDEERGIFIGKAINGLNWVTITQIGIFRCSLCKWFQGIDFYASNEG